VLIEHTIPLHKRVLKWAAMGVVFVVVSLAVMMLILHNLTELAVKLLKCQLCADFTHRDSDMCRCIYVYMYVLARFPQYIYICVYLHMCVCIRIHLYMCMCIHI